MSFIARNHPQQKRNPAVDDRATTWEVFNELDRRFNFTLDVAASAHNAKCERFYTIGDDGLTQPWIGSVWCNPPYSDIRPWVEKAWFEYTLERPRKIVMLLPANRTEQAWWQDLIEPARRSGEAKVEFLRGRMRFIAATDTEIKPNSRPPFGVCLAIWGNP